MPYSVLGYYTGRRKILGIRTTPPTTDALGALYIVGPNASGPWSGQDGRLAIQNGTEWKFVCPDLGFRVYNDETHEYIYKSGAGWSAWPPSTSGGTPTGQLDGGTPTSDYGGTEPIDGGGV